MRLFQNGQRLEFMALWTEHVPKKIRESDETAQKLEFYIYIYFFVYPFKHKGGVSVSVWCMNLSLFRRIGLSEIQWTRYNDTVGIRKKYQYIQTIDISSIN